MLLIYGIRPPEFPLICDGCRSEKSISNVLDYKRVSVIMNLHNELHDGVANPAKKAFIPLHVRNNPLTHKGSTMQSVKAKTAGQMRLSEPSLNNPPMYKEYCGVKVDPPTQDLWYKRTYITHDIRVVNTDAYFYLQRYPDKCIKVT